MSFTLQNNEHVILVARRHWLKPVSETIALLFSLLIPIIISSIAYSVPILQEQFTNIAILSIIFILSWLFLIWNIAFVIWTNHLLDVVVITNLHIIDIEQITLWHKEISTLNLEKIQDISTKTKGVIENMLTYGDLEIQTAGSMSNFILTRIEQPDLIRQKINEQINQSRSNVQI